MRIAEENFIYKAIFMCSWKNCEMVELIKFFKVVKLFEEMRPGKINNVRPVIAVLFSLQSNFNTG